MNPKTKLARMVAAQTLIPAHMIEGVTNYMDHGLRPGSFLYSLLCLDFIRAWHKADDINREAFGKWIEFLVVHCPEDSFGSRDAVEEWIAKGGTR